MKVGQGFDVHRFTTGRPLMIGGIRIPFERGLDGHSDADVLLHAVTDAVLGAMGEGDIGRHFPDTDDAYKDADSRKLLQQVWERGERAGFRLGHLDATIIAQQPKMAPYISEIRAVLADLFRCDLKSINVKATTTEWLGFIGRSEGIAAMAVVSLLERD